MSMMRARKPISAAGILCPGPRRAMARGRRGPLRRTTAAKLNEFDVCRIVSSARTPVLARIDYIEDDGTITASTLEKEDESEFYIVAYDGEFQFREDEVEVELLSYDYEQRQMPLGPANPHQEHSYEVFRIFFDSE